MFTQVRFRKVGPVVAALLMFASLSFKQSLAQTSRSEVSASITIRRGRCAGAVSRTPLQGA
jgi:hypothetical protein